jgi:hypothetical protein
MDNDSNAPPAPQASLGGSSDREFAIEEMANSNRHWRLVIRSSDLALYEPEDPQPFVLLREQLHTDVMLSEGLNVLAIKKPRKLTFRLTQEATSAVVAWLGEGSLASFYLKQRYSWVLAIAIIWIIGSLPLPGESDQGVEAVPMDGFGLALGLVLAIAWAFAKWRPHPALFLVDSLWFLCLSVYLTLEVWNGRSMLWMILVAILLWMAIKGFKHFSRFRRTRM